MRFEIETMYKSETELNFHWNIIKDFMENTVTYNFYNEINFRFFVIKDDQNNSDVYYGTLFLMKIQFNINLILLSDKEEQEMIDKTIKEFQSRVLRRLY